MHAGRQWDVKFVWRNTRELKEAGWRSERAGTVCAPVSLSASQANTNVSVFLLLTLMSPSSHLRWGWLRPSLLTSRKGNSESRKQEALFKHSRDLPVTFSSFPLMRFPKGMTVRPVMQEAGSGRRESLSDRADTVSHPKKKKSTESLRILGSLGNLKCMSVFWKLHWNFVLLFSPIKMYYKGKLQSRRSFLSINCRRNTLVRSNWFCIHVCTLVTEHTSLWSDKHGSWKKTEQQHCFYKTT